MIIPGIFLISGLIIGSFLNVLICRLPDIKSIIITRSHCPKCKKQIVWYDLIPLLSFLILSGRCRQCQKKISWQYPLVELTTGLLFLIIYLKFQLTIFAFFLIILSCILMVIFVYDWFHQIILDEMVIAGLIFTIIYYVFSYKWYDWQSIIIGGLAGLIFIGAIVLATRGRGMGIGDIKLIGLLGLVVGFPQVIVILMAGFIIGAIYGLGLIAARKKTMKDAIAFGPFLIIGFYISIFWGDKILNWYLMRM